MNPNDKNPFRFSRRVAAAMHQTNHQKIAAAAVRFTCTGTFAVHGATDTCSTPAVHRVEITNITHPIQVWVHACVHASYSAHRLDCVFVQRIALPDCGAILKPALGNMVSPPLYKRADNPCMLTCAYVCMRLAMQLKARVTNHNPSQALWDAAT